MTDRSCRHCHVIWFELVTPPLGRHVRYRVTCLRPELQDRDVLPGVRDAVQGFRMGPGKPHRRLTEIGLGSKPFSPCVRSLRFLTARGALAEFKHKIHPSIKARRPGYDL